MKSNSLNVAVIPGDGIGKEVIPEGLRVLEVAAERFELGLKFTHHGFSCAEYFTEHGQMMPDDWKAQIGDSDAIFFGAVGWPDTVPDHISLWQSLIKFRREFDQYVSLRPARSMPGTPSPLTGRGPGDIDMMIVRENTEGEYSSIGGRMFAGTQHHFPSLFEPVHGSAPDIAGKNIANPIGQIWAGAMMLEHLGHKEAADAIVSSIETVLAEKHLRTADLGGTATTTECGAAVADALGKL